MKIDIFSILLRSTLFVVTFIVVTAFTDWNLLVCIILGLMAISLDVFILSPMTKRAVERETRE